MKKFEFIKAMNTIVTSLNDEKAYGEWITIVPDEATDDDFMQTTVFL